MTVAVYGHAPYKAVSRTASSWMSTTAARFPSRAGPVPQADRCRAISGKYGADIVRLWVSSMHFTDEVPFGEETFTRLADTYRPFATRCAFCRQSARFRRGALRGGAGGVHDSGCWVMHLLGQIVAICREAYAKFEYHRVYHTINQFCAVDLSALYVDITKDRLYCDRVDSPRRRATQTVMHRVFGALCRLLAPVLVFTAEEAWGHFGGTSSIHTEKFPDADTFKVGSGAASAAFIEKLLPLREKIGQAIEPARQAKQIGSSLEAEVVLEIADDALLAELRGREAELEEFFILSSLTLQPGARDQGHAETERGQEMRALLASSPRGIDREVARSVRALCGSGADTDRLTAALGRGDGVVQSRDQFAQSWEVGVAAVRLGGGPPWISNPARSAGATGCRAFRRGPIHRAAEMKYSSRSGRSNLAARCGE